MKIQKITREKFTGKVYNFHCLPNENYFSENILVHNCYKGNRKGSNATNMSFETFHKIFKTFPPTLTQIAFGITSVGSHPELFKIFQYCRDNGVIPNVTINGADPLTDEQIGKLVQVCGAMAISVVWPTPEKGFDLIKRINNAFLNKKILVKKRKK